MHFVYIIYSSSTDRFYIGETAEPEARLLQHNSAYYAGASTRFAKDWVIKLVFKVMSRSEALKVEAYLKSMKSKKYLHQLCMDKAIGEKLKERVEEKFGVKIL